MDRTVLLHVTQSSAIQQAGGRVQIAFGRSRQQQDLSTMLHQARIRPSLHHMTDPGAFRTLPFRLLRTPGCTPSSAAASAREPITIPLIVDEYDQVLDFSVQTDETATSAVDRFVALYCLSSDYILPLRAIAEAHIHPIVTHFWDFEYDESGYSPGLSDAISWNSTLHSGTAIRETSIVPSPQSPSDQTLPHIQFDFCINPRHFASRHHLPLDHQSDAATRSTDTTAMARSEMLRLAYDHILPHVATCLNDHILWFTVEAWLLTAVQMLHPLSGDCHCDVKSSVEHELLRAVLCRQLVMLHPTHAGGDVEHRIRANAECRLRTLFLPLRSILETFHEDPAGALRGSCLGPASMSAIECIARRMEGHKTDPTEWATPWAWDNIFTPNLPSEVSSNLNTTLSPAPSNPSSEGSYPFDVASSRSGTIQIGLDERPMSPIARFRWSNPPTDVPASAESSSLLVEDRYPERRQSGRNTRKSVDYDTMRHPQDSELSDLVSLDLASKNSNKRPCKRKVRG
ncbi:hypothetical protein LTR53_005101 [Teratosphaeriaceae sp. CCFEE 6253]|nr:hypothetical protein LTR53_005101 [Teratosphaeriaceae sp. CCFEE 6253]